MSAMATELECLNLAASRPSSKGQFTTLLGPTPDAGDSPASPRERPLGHGSSTRAFGPEAVAARPGCTPRNPTFNQSGSSRVIVNVGLREPRYVGVAVN